VKLYQDWQRDGYAGTIVQANVEDTGLGVQEYALKKLNIEIVELKWGQGAKDIGGEVKIKDLAKAQMLKSRGYVVFPDPSDPEVIGTHESGWSQKTVSWTGCRNSETQAQSTCF
jgi:hypothetical protein